MKLAIRITHILLAASLLAACGRGGKETSDSTTVADSLVAVADTAPQEPPKPVLKTTQDQLAFMKSSEDWEKFEGGILPQMAEDAPEYCEKILNSEGKRFIIVDKGKMKVFLYDPYGNVELKYGIACAKNYGTKHKKGDSRTTEGIFEVEGVYDSTNWLFTDDNGYTSPTKGQYGPRFIRLTIPYIGIHGTGSPWSIGKRCSHGCIRVTNDHITELVKYVEPGMPVIISPGPRDMAVNESEGYNVLSVATEPGTPRARPGRYAPPADVEKKTASADSVTSAREAEPATATAAGEAGEESGKPTTTESEETLTTD